MTKEYRSRHSALLALAGWVPGLIVLAGCAHHAPATIHGNTAVISGHNTAQASKADATQTVLVEAAAITVDHGYRYFEVITPVRPGADVTIRVYGKGEIDERTPNVYDADAIGAGQMPAPARSKP